MRAKTTIAAVFFFLCLGFSQGVSAERVDVCWDLPGNTTWVAGNVYVIQCDNVRVPAGITLTIQAGAIVKFHGGDLIVDGTLNVAGSAGSPVQFTSYNDDAVGGDTDGDGGARTPTPGDWNAVTFDGGSTGNLSHAVFAYGGGNYWYYDTKAEVRCYTDGLHVDSCTFQQSGYNGIYAHQKGISVSDCTFGPGNAVVRVSADLETDATTLTEEKYDPEGQVIRSQTTTDDTTSSSESRNVGGAVGVSANVPEKSANTETARPVSNSEQNRKNRTTTYEINRTTTNITRTPGSIKKVSAAVFVAMRSAPPAAGAARGAAETPATKRTPEEIAALRQVVVNALGLKLAAGESLDSLVTLQEVPFATAPALQQIETMRTEGRWQTWIEAASRWAAVAAAGAVLLVFLRLLARQKPEPVPIEMLTLKAESARSLQSSDSITPEMLNELIRQKPANIGTALRDWMSATKN